jgi:hypothetical protein
VQIWRRMKMNKAVADINKRYQYIKSVVAFLDILGFKSMVYNQGNNRKFTLMFKMINEINKMNLSKMHLKGLKITSISDSIVVSVPYKEKASFEKITRTLYELDRLFFSQGFLLRGAITIGDIYHENGIVFGPAVVEAYFLEHDCAIYPRCIVKKNALHEGLKTCNSNFGRNDMKELYQQDIDGLFFYNYLRDEFEFQLYEDRRLENPCKIYDKMLEVKCFIEGFLKEIYSDRVLMKYEWLKRYYNNIVLEFDHNKSLECKRFMINVDEVI